MLKNTKSHFSRIGNILLLYVRKLKVFKIKAHVSLLFVAYGFSPREVGQHLKYV